LDFDLDRNLDLGSHIPHLRRRNLNSTMQL
jgi:hypothetical protein